MAFWDGLMSKFGYIRYSDGSNYYRILQNNTNYLNGQDKLNLSLNHSTLSSVISIRADYLSKVLFYVEEQDGTKNFDDSSLEFTKNPNPHQSGEDFLKQYEWFMCAYGWTYQRPYLTSVDKNVKYLYNLNPSQIQFPSKMGDALIITKSDENKYYRNEFAYTDVNSTKSIRFEDIIPFYDVTNSINNQDTSSVTSTSRLDSIIKEASNVSLASDAENVTLQTNGKQIFWSEQGGGNIIDGEPLSSDDQKEIKRVLNSPLGTKRGERILASTKKIGYQDATIALKDLGLNESRETNSNIIAQRYQVDNEIYKAFTNGDTFENKKQAELNFIQNVIQPRADDLASSWTYSFGDPNRPFKASFDHLPTMQIAEDKRADKALKISTAMRNLISSGLTEEQAREFLNTLDIQI